MSNHNGYSEKLRSGYLIFGVLLDTTKIPVNGYNNVKSGLYREM